MISNRPYWLDTVTEADFLPPGHPAAAELPSHARIAIIGGGIVGLACAHYLAAAGADGVLLFERGQLLHEASAANGGGLWPAEQAKGPGIFYNLGRASLELIRQFTAGLDRDVEFRGELRVMELARSEEEAAALHAKAEHRRSEGIAAEWREPDEVCELEPALARPEVFGAVRYPEDSHVNPAKLGAAFARSARAGGVRILTGLPVRGYEELDHLTRLFTDRGMVDVSHVVLTTGAWASDAAGFLHLKIPVEPAKGQLVATAPMPPLLRSHAVIGPYGVLQTGAGNVLSGGNVEFAGYDSEPSAAIVERVWSEARKLVPALQEARLTHSWARLRPYTPDELPLLGLCGRDQRHVVAAGHFRNGLLLSAVSGKIVADLLTRGETAYPLAGLEPDRFRTEPGGA